MTYVIAVLPPQEIIPAWPGIWEVLEPAVKRAPRSIRYSYDGLLLEVAQKKTQVWLVIDLETNEIAGAVTTAIATAKDFPDETLLEVPLLAGVRFREWIGDVLGVLIRWGMTEGATTMVGYGRKGWEKVCGFTYFGETEDGVRIMTRPIGLEH